MQEEQIIKFIKSLGVAEASRVLGISPPTVYKRLKDPDTCTLKELRIMEESLTGVPENPTVPTDPVPEENLPEQRFRPAESYPGVATQPGINLEGLAIRVRRLEEWASLGGNAPALKDIGEPVPSARPSVISGEHPLAQLHRQGYAPSDHPPRGPLTESDGNWNDVKPYYRERQDRR
jgi:hypothetical protein